MLERYISPKNFPLLLSCIVFLFAFLLYQNTVPNDYSLDDVIYYTGNKFVQQGFNGFKGIFTKSTWFGFNGKNDQIYRPLPVACFAAQYSFFGNNPHFNHFVNVLMYALCCSLLLFLLNRLMSGVPLAIPFCITLLFTAHPIHTEVVANIKGLDEILAFFFFTLTLLFLLNHLDRKRPVFIVLSVLSFFLCLLCKEHGLTLLGTLPLALWIFRSLPVKKIILQMLPFCGMALFYLAFRNSMLDHFTFGEPLALINNALMAADNKADQFATVFLILGKYLKLLFIPYPLCWDYSYNQIPITTWLDPKVIFSLVLYAGLLIAGIVGTINKRHLAFAILFFLISFSLSSNLFLKIGVTLGERLLFAPSLGFCIAMVVLFSKATVKLRFRTPLATAITGAVIAVYAAIIVNRNTDWKDDETLFSHDIIKNNNSASAHNNLGAIFLYKGRIEKDDRKKDSLFLSAVAELRKSVALYPSYTNSWYLLGVALTEAGRSDSAIMAYRKNIELQPDDRSAINNIGVLYVTLQRYDSAAYYFRKEVSLDTDNITANVNLGAVELLLKNYGNALAAYKKVTERDPHNKDASLNLYRLSQLLKDTVLTRKYRPSVCEPGSAANKQ